MRFGIDEAMETIKTMCPLCVVTLSREEDGSPVIIIEGATDEEKRVVSSLNVGGKGSRDKKLKNANLRFV